MAGFYLAFSVVIMPALRRLPGASGAAAMQRFNEDAPKAWVPVAVPVAVLSVVLAVAGGRDVPRIDGVLLVLGALAYLSSVAITFAFHIPRNNRLAATDPATDDGAAYWTVYLAEWNPMNHVRTLTCVVAAVCFAVALGR